MKKYISLLWAAIMLLSSFAILTSCGGGEETPTPDGDNPTARAQVTEEEWIRNWQQNNYTLSAKILYTDKYTTENIIEYMYGSLSIKMNDTAFQYDQQNLAYGAKESYSFLQIAKNGDHYTVYDNFYTGRTEAIKGEQHEWINIAGVVYSYNVDLMIDQAYAAFTYDEAERCYSYAFASPNNISIKAWFEDGVITKIKLETDWEDEGYYGIYVYDFVITNVGSTQVDIPDYTVVEQ